LLGNDLVALGQTAKKSKIKVENLPGVANLTTGEVDEKNNFSN